MLNNNKQKCQNEGEMICPKLKTFGGITYWINVIVQLPVLFYLKPAI